MPIRAFLRHHWPAITITVTAAAIGCAAFVMLGNMPPHRIVMATGPEGSAYAEYGKRYRSALAKAGVDRAKWRWPAPFAPRALPRFITTTKQSAPSRRNGCVYRKPYPS